MLQIEVVTKKIDRENKKKIGLEIANPSYGDLEKDWLKNKWWNCKYLYNVKFIQVCTYANK